MNKQRIAITGAAGNLGSLLVKRLLCEDVNLNLLIHQKEVPYELSSNQKTETFSIDLRNKEGLFKALEKFDVVVPFAGVLFKPNPEKFLKTTNTQYFQNLLDVAVKQKVKRIILISFSLIIRRREYLMGIRYLFMQKLD